jgi:hypothetical protein
MSDAFATLFDLVPLPEPLITPRQFADARRGASKIENEKRLYYAVLEQAVRDLNLRESQTSYGKRLYREARQWIAQEEKLAGYVTEATIAGLGFLRIDVHETCHEALEKDGYRRCQKHDCDSPYDVIVATQYISLASGSIYAMTPVSEEVARLVAKTNGQSRCTRGSCRRSDIPRPLAMSSPRIRTATRSAHD